MSSTEPQEIVKAILEAGPAKEPTKARFTVELKINGEEQSLTIKRSGNADNMQYREALVKMIEAAKLELSLVPSLPLLPLTVSPAEPLEA